MANNPNQNWMQTRQTKFAAYTTVYVLIVVAVIAGLNFLANRYNKSYDTTANKQYTLSDQTVKIAKDLKQPITITYWDQPTRFQGAHDLLDRYKNLSPKIEVVYSDVDKQKRQAIAAGVNRTGMIFVNSGNKHVEAKSLTEEEITGAMVRAIKSGERMVCFVQGSGEHPLEDAEAGGYSQLKTLTEGNNYKTQSINLLQKPEIPKDCLIVVVGGPTRDYTAPEVAALKNFVENGGRAVFMIDPPIKLGREEIDENGPLVSQLADWGVTLDKDLVLDPTGIGQLYGVGPEVALVGNYGTHVIAAGMKRTASLIPLARALELKSTDKSAPEKLFESSDDTMVTTNLSSAEVRLNPNDKKGPFVLAAASTYKTGKEAGNGRFVVVGSSRWVTNGYLRAGGNRDLFLNMLNWLSADEDLISIRPKEPEDRRLNMTQQQISLVLYSSVIMIPLLIVVAGVGVWWRRR